MSREQELRDYALHHGDIRALLYALVRAMQRIDINQEIGYVGDADVLHYIKEGESLLDAVLPEPVADPTTLISILAQQPEPEPEPEPKPALAPVRMPVEPMQPFRRPPGRPRKVAQ